MNEPTVRALALAVLLSASFTIVACSSPDREAAEPDSGEAGQTPATPANPGPGPAPIAAAVCDSVAARWQRAGTTFTRSDTVAQMNSMPGPATVCVVTAVAEDDSGAKRMTSGYWSDSTSGGWRGITGWDADGPDGMSRTLFRSGVRCQVDGEWDGGDDSNPAAVRSKRVTERTTCWGDGSFTTPGHLAQLARVAGTRPRD